MSHPAVGRGCPVCRQSDRGSDPGTGCPAFFTCGASAPRLGKFAAGTTYNAVAEYAELEGTTRTISQETRLQVREWIDQTAEQIAAISGAEARVIWSDITSALINDPQVSREAAEVAKGLGDHIQVVTNRPLSLGGDNFAEYQRFVPGCYAYIGTANTDLPSTLNSLHNGNFDLDENALVLGAGLVCGIRPVVAWKAGEAMIQLEHISKRYVGPSGTVDALKDVSVHVEKGDIYGIIGSSGAGKSTLLRMVNQLEKPDTGTVTVAGRELSTLSKAELRKMRRKIGMVFQQFNLLESKTVFQNVAIPLILEGIPKEKITERVKEVLHIVELHDKRDTYVTQLSGGQKQRVLLARALCATKKLLLLDEPVTGLDPLVTAEFYQLIEKINKEAKIAVVMVSHDIESTIQYASHILHLQESALFYGTAQEYQNSAVGKRFLGGEGNA